MDILFRGFHECDGPTTIVVDGRMAKGEWVNGYPVGWQNEKGDISIVDSRFGACIDESGNLIMLEAPFVAKVIPSTVGQFCGKQDKNGRKIFKGDRAKTLAGVVGEVKMGAYVDRHVDDDFGPTDIYYEGFGWHIDTGELFGCIGLDDFADQWCEVIGTVWDEVEK